MTRMAGEVDVSAFMNGPDLGALSQKSFVNDAKEDISGIRSEGLVGGTALAQFGETVGHGAVNEAKAAYGAAQQQASNMTSAGNLLGTGISGLFGGN